MQARPAVEHKGFTLVELLVGIGLLAVLLALFLPVLNGPRSAARSTVSLSNIRQMGTGLQMYADSNNGLPPVFGAPAWPVREEWRFDYGTAGSGNWFEHSYMYGLEVVALLENPAVGLANGNPSPSPVVSYKGRSTRIPDFHLTNTLYAEPAFFSWATQTGLPQFRAQTMSDAAYPSSKGLLWTPWTFSNPQYGSVASCCSVDVPSPVAFFDLSASGVIMRRMRPGMWNLYEPMVIHPTADPRTTPGTPVANTFDGIRGVDR